MSDSARKYEWREDDLEWPLCGETTTLMGDDWVMTCQLPRGHQLDGQKMHEDPEKGQWLITLTNEDGIETFL